MNGYFIFNTVMAMICFMNLIIVYNDPYARTWVRLLLLFLAIMVTGIAAISYGTGPLSGSWF